MSENIKLWPQCCRCGEKLAENQCPNKCLEDRETLIDQLSRCPECGFEMTRIDDDLQCTDCTHQEASDPRDGATHVVHYADGPIRTSVCTTRWDFWNDPEVYNAL